MFFWNSLAFSMIQRMSTQLSESESWLEECDPEVLFTLITGSHLAVNPPMLALGSMIMISMVWTSGAASTSRHKHRCRDHFLHDYQCRSEAQSSHTGTTLCSQLGFSTLKVKSLGHFSQYHLHLRKININQTWGMAELRKESRNT